MTHLALDRKALSIRGRERPATPMLRQGLMVLKVYERRDRRFERFLTQVPRTDPSQTIKEEIGIVGQLAQAHIGALRHDGGVEV